MSKNKLYFEENHKSREGKNTVYDILFRFPKLFRVQYVGTLRGTASKYPSVETRMHFKIERT